jgi:hypothetical protein
VHTIQSARHSTGWSIYEYGGCPAMSVACLETGICFLSPRSPWKQVRVGFSAPAAWGRVAGTEETDRVFRFPQSCVVDVNLLLVEAFSNTLA